MMGYGSAMKRRMKSEERRAAIVAVAARLFAEKGFRGTTTRELASILNVTEPVLYRHFRTKRDLYHAIIDAKAREGADAIAKLENWVDADDTAFLTRLGEHVLKHFEHDRNFVRLLLFSALEGDELAHRFYDRQITPLYRMLAAFIKRRTGSGLFRDANVAIAARAFIGMVSYHGLASSLFRDRALPSDRRKLAAEMAAIFLDGLRAVPPNAH